VKSPSIFRAIRTDSTSKYILIPTDYPRSHSHPCSSLHPAPALLPHSRSCWRRWCLTLQRTLWRKLWKVAGRAGRGDEAMEEKSEAPEGVLELLDQQRMRRLVWWASCLKQLVVHSMLMKARAEAEVQQRTCKYGRRCSYRYPTTTLSEHKRALVISSDVLYYGMNSSW